MKKPYFKIRITKEVKADLDIWLSFLKGYNGKSIMSQIPITECTAINLYTDASKKGFGGFYGSAWVQGDWPAGWISLNITVLELYPIVLILQMFGHKLANTSLLFHCDNMAIVECINRQTSKCPLIMKLIRKLVLILLRYNIRFCNVQS